MSVHISAQSKTPRRRTWLRGLCLTGVLALIGIAAVSGTAQEDGGSKSSLFRVPSLFRSASQEVAAPPAPPEGRFVRRARQLISDAQQLESAGHVPAALEMARRADNVLSTASSTTGVQWPAGQRTPADYVSALEERVRASSPQQPQAPMSRTANAPLGPAEPNNPAGRGLSPTQDRLPTNAVSQSDGLLLDWRNRNRATASSNTPTGSTGPASPGTGPIQLLGVDGQSVGSALRDDGNAGGDDTSNLLDKLRSLDTWDTPGQPVANTARGESSPAPAPTTRDGMPAIGGWQPDINDQNVGPIPTQVPHTPFDNGAPELAAPELHDPPERLVVEEPAVATPVGDDVEIADADPPVLQSVETSPREPSGSPTSDRTERQSIPNSATSLAGAWNQGSGQISQSPERAEPNLLITAAVQVLATFVGVLLAILVFRAVAIRIWGPGMGILVPVAQNNSIHGDAANADIVPFEGRDDTESEKETTVVDPASVPFRLVGSSYDDERLADEQAEREREEAILKSVFDQNVNLLDELQGMKKSA